MLLDCSRLERRRASGVACLQKFLNPGLALPVDLGRSPRTSSLRLVGVMGARGVNGAPGTVALLLLVKEVEGVVGTTLIEV